MEHLVKFNHATFTSTFIKLRFPKHFQISLSPSLKILSCIILSLISYFFLKQKQEHTFLALSVIIFSYTIYKTYSISSSSSIYLVDYSCLKPPNWWRVPFSSFLEHSRIVHNLDQQSVDFMSKVLVSSGQSQRTCIPPPLHYIPPRSTHEEAIEEAKLVLFPVFEDLLSKTKISPLEIDIIIVNCSGSCPSPSLSSIIINHYSMREDIKSYNISGMGCSASALAVIMAQDLLKVYKNSNVVILSTEILSNGWYAGKNRSMMVLNCLFRAGGAAILISNKTSIKKNSKYRLLYAVRTQGAYDDIAYNSAIREEDSEGNMGVTLKKDVLHVAGELLRSNFHVLGSFVLPLEEKLRYGYSIMNKKWFDKSKEVYVPNFRKVIQHYCLPTSGKQVINEIGGKMKLKDEEIEAALMTLHRFGNQSSSSLWYELAYMEGKERVKQGERVLQLGMGSGPKCNSLVWECNRPIVGEAQKGPWADCIHEYPVYSHKDK
ncbi:3-ketoacyl-CoA synthase 5-like [Rutidosis leptorrhynchoides]|uniref:3-ketoacyl-CoA synthase 5-like n=1 Tax=Rutidosis leptorrhynchoides TaxID=125765 RepID=UPI003A996D22